MRTGGTDTWGLEAIMLSAGTNVEWLRDDLGILPSSEASHQIAQQCDDTGGVVYVPALMGLGTPQWDYGARGTLLGLTRGSGRPEIVRAVLEGIAARGADLVEAAELDAGATIDVLRVDGGMSRNPTFVQALADAAQKPVEISPVCEATTLGAGFLAGLAVGMWPGVASLADTWAPIARYEPGAPTRPRAVGRGRPAVLPLARGPLGGRVLGRVPGRHGERARRVDGNDRTADQQVAVHTVGGLPLEVVADRDAFSDRLGRIVDPQPECLEAEAPMLVRRLADHLGPQPVGPDLEHATPRGRDVVVTYDEVTRTDGGAVELREVGRRTRRGDLEGHHAADAGGREREPVDHGIRA